MDYVELPFRLGFLLEHDLFRKPVSTFRDHALMDRGPIAAKDDHRQDVAKDNIGGDATGEGPERFPADDMQVAKPCRQADREKAEYEGPGPQRYQRGNDIWPHRAAKVGGAETAGKRAHQDRSGEKADDEFGEAPPNFARVGDAPA